MTLFSAHSLFFVSVPISRFRLSFRCSSAILRVILGTYFNTVWAILPFLMFFGRYISVFFLALRRGLQRFSRQVGPSQGNEMACSRVEVA